MKVARRQYSIYEAKARLSELIRTVKGRHAVVITERGVPVARVVPIEPARGGLAQRLQELASTGELLTSDTKPRTLRALGKRPGALTRFLSQRD